MPWRCVSHFRVEIPDAAALFTDGVWQDASLLEDMVIDQEHDERRGGLHTGYDATHRLLESGE